MPAQSTPNLQPEQLALEIHTPAGKANLRLSRLGRSYTVVAFEVPERPHLTLAFSPKGPGVENLDDSSDAAQVFGLSCKVRYNGVVLGNDEMRANSFEELKYALSKVKVRTFNSEEI